MKEHLDGDVISAWLDGALDSAEGKRADAHFASCGDCRAERDSLRHMKSVLASAPRRGLPADLALSLEKRFTGAPIWARMRRRSFWIPAGAVAAAGLAVGLWMRASASADELPLEPLLAAHARYSAELLVPEDNLVAANYSELSGLGLDKAADVEME